MKVFAVVVLALFALSEGAGWCRDRNLRCSEFKRWCYLAHVKNLCHKTCGVCGVGPTEPPRTPRPSGVPPPLPKTCGNPAVQMQRVIAGTDAVPHSWPWQILMLKRGRSMCGGSIISAKTIVTAAHCVYRDVYNPGTFTVRVGDHDKTKTEGTERDYKVKRIIVHPKWDARKLNNDIAMFELEKPIQFDDNVMPVCMPQDDPPVGTKCYITGWGKTKHPGSMTNILQQAVMPVVDSKVCYAKNSKVIPVPITDAMICSGDGGESRRSGCHGDSGGPFVCKIGDRWELHGAVSHGSPRCASTDTYTVFARVAHFKSWIFANMS